MIGCAEPNCWQRWQHPATNVVATLPSISVCCRFNIVYSFACCCIGRIRPDTPIVNSKHFASASNKSPIFLPAAARLEKSIGWMLPMCLCSVHLHLHHLQLLLNLHCLLLGEHAVHIVVNSGLQ